MANDKKRIHTALISVFDKTGLEPLIKTLHKNNEKQGIQQMVISRLNLITKSIT